MPKRILPLTPNSSAEDNFIGTIDCVKGSTDGRSWSLSAIAHKSVCIVAKIVCRLRIILDRDAILPRGQRIWAVDHDTVPLREFRIERQGLAKGVRAGDGDARVHVGHANTHVVALFHHEYL